MMKRRSSQRLALFILLQLAPTLAACGVATPRVQDAPAPTDFYKQATEKEKPCDRPIQVLPAGSSLGRPYREMASLSATCSPGSTELCERRLKERACEMGADALLLGETEPGPNPNNVPIQSLVSRNARALQWEGQ